MSVKKISMYEQVLVGNFSGNGNEQESAAKKYSSIMTDRMTEYCNKNYPGLDVEIDFRLENASGYTSGFSAHVDCECKNDDEWAESRKIIDDIESEYRSMKAELERSGEIYE